MLLYTGANNGYDGFNGNIVGDNAVHTIVAEADGTVIGLNSGFDNGVDEIDSGTFANVMVMGTANNDTLDFSMTTSSGVPEIDAGHYNDTVTVLNDHTILGITNYDGNHGTDTLIYDDAVYDINTGTGEGVLDNISTVLLPSVDLNCLVFCEERCFHT